MNTRKYKDCAALLVDLLPEVAKQDCFALYGGTAINFFVLDMPRYSIDLDLNYIAIEDRQTTLRTIASAMSGIKAGIESAIPGILTKQTHGDTKLLVELRDISVKLEANIVRRGLLEEPRRMPLCAKAQAEFGVPPHSMRIMPFGQLYAGKIAAALGRQHPRDLFDAKKLLDGEGFTDSVKTAFVLELAAAQGNIHELLNPNFHDRRNAIQEQFAGMSDENFTHEDHQSTLRRLVDAVREGLAEQDKAFLLSVVRAAPDWSIHDFERFPNVQWKQLNLRRLKTDNPQKHRRLLEQTEAALRP